MRPFTVGDEGTKTGEKRKMLGFEGRLDTITAEYCTGSKTHAVLHVLRRVA